MSTVRTKRFFAEVLTESGAGPAVTLDDPASLKCLSGWFNGVAEGDFIQVYLASGEGSPALVAASAASAGSQPFTVNCTVGLAEGEEIQLFTHLSSGAVQVQVSGFSFAS